MQVKSKSTLFSGIFISIFIFLQESLIKIDIYLLIFDKLTRRDNNERRETEKERRFERIHPLRKRNY